MKKIAIRKNENYLKLKDDAVITFEKKASINATGIEAQDFSYPFNIPVTGNEKILDFLHDIDTLGDSFATNVIIENERNSRTAVLEISDITYDLNKKSGTASANVKGATTVVEHILKDKKLNELNLGEIQIPLIAYDDIPDAYKFHVNGFDLVLFSQACYYAEQVTKGNIESECTFPTVYAPQAWTYYDDPNFSLWNMGPPKGLINMWGTMQSFMDYQTFFGNNNIPPIMFPTDTFPPFQPWLSAAAKACVLRNMIVPMFRLIKIVKRILNYCGFQVYGDALTAAEYQIPIVMNTHAINEWQYNSGIIIGDINDRYQDVLDFQDLCTKITVANHLPDVDAFEFLQSALRLLGLKIETRLNNDVELISIADPLKNIETYNEDFELFAQYKKKLVEESKIEDVLAYTFPDTASDVPLEYEENPQKIDTVIYAAPMGSIPHPRNGQTALAKIWDKLYMYSSSEAAWIPFAYNFKEFAEGETFTLVFGPPEMKIKEFELVHNFFSVPMLPLADGYVVPAIYSEGSQPAAIDVHLDQYTLEASNNPNEPIIALYYGLQKPRTTPPPDNEEEYPFASFGNYAQALKINDYCLALEGPDNIREYFLNTWRTLTTNKTIFNFKISCKTATLPDVMQYINILGHRFLITKIKYQEPFNSVVEIECYRL